MITDTTIPAKLCTCDICHYQWVSIAAKLPECCRNILCRSREWNGKTLKSHAHEIKLPAPRKPGRPKTITLLEDEEL